jgi:hypothetical protein
LRIHWPTDRWRSLCKHGEHDRSLALQPQGKILRHKLHPCGGVVRGREYPAPECHIERVRIGNSSHNGEECSRASATMSECIRRNNAESRPESSRQCWSRSERVREYCIAPVHDLRLVGNCAGRCSHHLVRSCRSQLRRYACAASGGHRQCVRFVHADDVSE